MSLPKSNDINVAVNGSKDHTCHSFAQSFRSKADEASNEGWSLLEQVFNYHYRAENLTEPFGPMTVMGDRRTAIPSDLSEEQLAELESTLEGIEKSEYHARINDVLWLRRKDQSYARRAVAAYMDSGKILEDPENGQREWSVTNGRSVWRVRLNLKGSYTKTSLLT